MVEAHLIADLARLEALRGRAMRANEKVVGDQSLAEVLTLLEYELAKFHGGAFECNDVQRLIAQIRVRVGEPAW